MDRQPDERREGRITTDRETIRRWADDHGAIPVRSASADDETEGFRVVRESSASESHDRVEWEAFFDRLDEGDHVVVYHGSEASEPFEVARRDDVLSRSGLDQEELEERLLEGETVTSEVTETTVVESVVVEEATVESELVGSEVVDQRVVDVELVERECTGCSLVEEGERTHDEWFDESRYFEAIGGTDFGYADADAASGQAGAETGPTSAETGSTGDAETGRTGDTGSETRRSRAETGRTGDDMASADPDATPIESTEEFPYRAEFDVEEAWSVTREFTERFTVESRVESTDVAETDTVEDRDIDVEGLHRSIAGSGLLDVDLSSEEVLSECDIRTEFDEDDRIRTQFDRERVVEDEVVDRKHLRADVTGGDFLGMEPVRSQRIAAETTGGASAGEASTASADAGAGGADGVDRTTITDDAVGKTVVDATGEEIGMVTDVEEGGDAMYVDAHPGITERIKAALDWGEAGGDDDYPVEARQVARVTGDRVELRGAEQLDEDERSR